LYFYPPLRRSLPLLLCCSVPFNPSSIHLQIEILETKHKRTDVCDLETPETSLTPNPKPSLLSGEDGRTGAEATVVEFRFNFGDEIERRKD